MQQPRLQMETVPARVGRYEILVPIASGGMATVYLARARGAAGFERDVAIKVTHPHVRDSVDFARALIDEAKIAVRIRHANVVPVLDVGDDPLGLFLVMEYVEGDTFSGIMRRAAAAGTPLTPQLGAHVLLDALAGLHAAHEIKDDLGALIGVVHRDFSPQNILVGVDGIARLTDFGIAKAASRLGETRTGVVKGKIRYMAPEQARGQAIDRRCDIWAAGVIAWELFAARRLYEGSDEDVGLIFRIASETPPRLRTVRPDIGAEIEEVVARALAPDKEARYATAAEFARDLARALRAGGVFVADAAEVAEHVERSVGVRLADRRKKAREVLARREGSGDETVPCEPLVEAPDWNALEKAISDRPPSADVDLVSEEISLQTLATPSDAGRSGEVLRTPRPFNTIPAPPPGPETTGTMTRNIVGWFTQSADQAGRRAVVLVVVAAVALAGLLVLVLGVVTSGSRTPPPAASAEAPSATESASPADRATATAMAAAPAVTSSADDQAATRADAPRRVPPATPPPARTAAPPKPPAQPAATHRTPNLDKPF